MLVQGQVRASYPNPAWLCSPVRCAGSYSCKHGNSQRKPKIPIPSTLQRLRIIYQQLQEQCCANTTSRNHQSIFWGDCEGEKKTPKTPKHKPLAGMIHLKIPTSFSRSEAPEQECLSLPGMRGGSRHWAGSHANTELGGQAQLPHPGGTGSTGGTHTQSWDRGAQGLGEVGKNLWWMWDTNQSLGLWVRG